MTRWKYKIGLRYINGDNSVRIDGMNINKLFIDHDYENKIMPTIYCDMSIDKNLFDDIILNASNATMRLWIAKIDADAETPTEITIYNHMCEYFIDHDINYNKDIEYPEVEKDEAIRKDILRDVQIGLMFKDCIENNKKVTNMTVLDSTMMNVVGSVIQDIPTLIEPFTYNPEFKQLIVPPLDTVVKTLDFLNDVQVFYDTNYRIFFEPYGMFIVSSSGKPTKMKTDKFDTVVFVIKTIKENGALALGMDENNEAECYVVNVNALDTKYTIDHDTAKKFTGLKAILDPAIENSLPALSSISNIMGKISGLADSVTGSIKAAAKSLESIPSALNQNMTNIRTDVLHAKDKVPGLLGSMDGALAAILAMPETAPAPGSGTSSGPPPKTLSKADKDKIKKDLEDLKNKFKDDTETYYNITTDFGSSRDSAISIMGNVTNLPSYVGGVTPINVGDNIGNLNSSFMSTKDSNKTYGTNCTNMKNKYDPLISGISQSCSDAITIIQSSGIEAEKIKDFIANLSAGGSFFNEAKNNALGGISNLIGLNDKVADTISAIGPTVSNLMSGKTNLSGLFSNTGLNANVLGSFASNAVNSIKSAAENAAKAVAEAGLSIAKLSDLEKDITSIKDITSLGKLGISSIDMQLGIGTPIMGNAKPKGNVIVKINNDNANKLKNIKSEIENKQNKIHISKNDLDISVFDINKMYLIKNFDARSDKDGTFLLDRRTDIFLREDDKLFTVNNQLYFSKIANDDNGASKASEIDGQELTGLLDPEEVKDLYNWIR